MNAVFDDFGVRFEHPGDWDVDVSDDGSRTTISLQSAAEPAFAMVALDGDRPDPQMLVDEAVTAMLAEYPDLENQTSRETIDGHLAIGQDLTFLSLDLASQCVIRGFRTPRRTVLIFAQWADVDDPRTVDAIVALRRTFEETDT